MCGDDDITADDMITLERLGVCVGIGVDDAGVDANEIECDTTGGQAVDNRLGVEIDCIDVDVLLIVVCEFNAMVSVEVTS